MSALLSLKLSAVAFCVVLLSPASGQVSAPDTPAGRTLQAWLAAVNSLDRGQIRAYIEQYEPSLSVAGELGFGESTGGLDLSSIEQSERLRIVFFVTDRDTGTRRLGKLDVEERDGKPTVISRYLWVMPPGSRMLGFEVSDGARDDVVRAAAAKYRELHMHPDVGERMARDLETRLQRGEYDGVNDGQRLADLLTEHIRATGGDTHLRVRFVATQRPARPPQPSPGAANRAYYEKPNCWVRSADVLPNNIGYLKIDAFDNPDVCGSTVSAAMTLVQYVDALIIDLRDNTGGTPEMVAFVSGYFFPEATHLIDIRTPASNTIEQHWTPWFVPGKRLTDTPLYLLTSSITHSAAENFVDGLKSRGRATVVGERTSGGAQIMGGDGRIDERFAVFIPTAEGINPLTNGNWSGTGIEPDVPVAADDALETALHLASQRLRNED